jgi:hypothetical protein
LDLPNESGIFPKLKRENAESNSKSKTAATLLANTDWIFRSLAQKTHGFDPKGNDLINTALWLANFTKWSDKLAQWLGNWRAAAFCRQWPDMPLKFNQTSGIWRLLHRKVRNRG